MYCKLYSQDGWRSYFLIHYEKIKKKSCRKSLIRSHKRKQFIFESGTGSGKTICVLAAALTFALENNKKIIYTTRTNAQQQQVILELRAIKKKTKDKRIFGVGMQGRGNMCLHARDDPEIQNGSSEELSKFCSHQKKLASLGKKERLQLLSKLSW